MCIAIHDRFVTPSGAFDSPFTADNGVQLLRLSVSIPWIQKASFLQNALQSFRPDWISLQYVPYAYHRKGLPLSLVRCLSPLRDLACWHIMVHELWVYPYGKPAHLILAPAQKLLSLFLFDRLAPRLLHTTNSHYKNLLLRSGFQARLLPLFSTIPVHPIKANEFRVEKIWKLLFFGSIHREWRPAELLLNIEKARLIHGILNCEFIAVGNTGADGLEIWAEMQSFQYPAFSFRHIGFLSETEISATLQAADFGITTTPSHLIGKSASVAAMLAHGLPVIVPRFTGQFSEWQDTSSARDQFILLDSNFMSSIASARRSSPPNQLEMSVGEFINSLETAV